MNGIGRIARLTLAAALLASAAGADRSQETAKGEEPLLREDLGCLDPGQDPEQATMSSMRNLGTALLSWASDRCDETPPEEAKRLSAAAMAQWRALEPEPEGFSIWLHVPHEALTAERLRAILIPSQELFYIREIPTLDGWCRTLEVVGSPDNPFGPSTVAIRSAGANGAFEGPRYEVGDFEPGDQLDDIVWQDGFFLRWPKGPAD